MPILQQEPDLYPDNLLQEEAEPSGSAEWYAIYTLSRREKELMRKLRAQGIAHYGPMTAKRTRSPAGRIRVSYVPLFSGYVFVRGSQEERYETVATGCVSKCLSVAEPEQLVTDLRQVRLLQEHGDGLQAELRPVEGQRVRIVRGLLKDRDLTGVITRVHNQPRLTVMVNFLQQGASIVVDEADVEVI